MRQPWAWRDMTSTWVWLKLLSAPKLALRPAHVGLALFLGVAVLVVARVPDLWLGKAADGTAILYRPGIIIDRQMQLAVEEFRERHIARAVEQLIVTPVQVVKAHPLQMALIAVPVLLIWGIMAGAISRSTAVTAATGRRLSWPAAMGQALTLWGSLLMSLLGPVMVVGGMLAILSMAGKLFFDKPAASLAQGGMVLVAILGVAIIVGAMRKKFKPKNIIVFGVIGLVVAGAMVLTKSAATYVGGAVYGVAIVFGLLTAVVGVISVLGMPMFPAAVTAEGTDAVDAVQRVWAYVIARPMRLAMYGVLLVALGFVLLYAYSAIVFGGLTVTAYAVARFVDHDFAGNLRQFGMFGEPPLLSTLKNEQGVAGAMIGFWVKATLLTIPAVAISYLSSAGSLLYLVMRKDCDGQDPADIWDPAAKTRISEAKIEEGGGEE